MDELRVKLTSDENRSSTTVAIVFRRLNDGIAIREEWNGYDEVWAKGYTVSIPERVWRLGMEWLLATPPSQT